MSDPSKTASSTCRRPRWVGGGDDGAIDILLVGLDSRTDAHGNPLTPEELATLRAGDEEATNTDTIILIRIPNNGSRPPRSRSRATPTSQAPGLGKTKINGVYGQTRETKRASLVGPERPPPMPPQKAPRPVARP